MIRNNASRYILDTTVFYNFTKYPPFSILLLEDFRLVADRLMNFTKVLFLDLDFDILWLMVCIFTALDAFGLSVIHSVIIFYVYYKLCIRWPRKDLGEMYLSKTSGVDDRFLI